MTKFAFVFPGQGSQAIGMLNGFADNAVVKATVAEASEALQFDLGKLIAEGPKEDLDLTTNTQPVMLTAAVAFYRAWLAAGGPAPALVAGHSLGEYSALVAAGVIQFKDAVPLVRFRAQAMQEAVPVGQGGMAKAKGAKRALALPVSAPFHSSLLKPASDRLQAYLQQVPFVAPVLPVINNVDVAIVDDPAAIKDALVRQAASAVRWVETVQKMAEQGITHVIECGPGKVLSGLTKRINGDLVGETIVDQASLNQVLELLK